MKLYLYNYMLGLALLIGMYSFSLDKSFVIVTASYNNKDWYQKNLDSVVNQTYDNWRMIYINDRSTDETGVLVHSYIQDYGLKNKIKLINNSFRRGHLANQYYAIHTCQKDEIIIILDGDDWLANNEVLSYLNEVYQDPNVWLTYGQFWYFKKNKEGVCHPVPDSVLRNNAFRDHPAWIFSHLRSFYAGLFHMIKLGDLLFERQFFPMAADAATMFPMVEMAAERALFISRILYIYNDDNPLSFYNQNKELQQKISHKIRGKQKYQRVQSVTFVETAIA